MSETSDRRINDADDATERLLRLAGARPMVAPQREARVRSAVHAHWRDGRRQRALARRVVGGSLLLACAVTLLVVIGRFNWTDRRAVPVGEVVAVVEQMDGIPQRVDHTADRSARVRLSQNDAIRTGQWIETDARARVALRFFDGTSARLDVGSRVRALSASVLELSAGAVYVDTGRESGQFEVRTAMATARDVGTQFEVRLLDRTVRLRVRTGIVELQARGRSVSARAGTEIMFRENAALSRPIAAFGSEWEWTARVSPALEFEGVSLSSFLERLAREQGWTVHYTEPALAREAAGIILHGSIDGLAPSEAVDVAIATSNLRHRLENGELVVLRTHDGK